MKQKQKIVIFSIMVIVAVVIPIFLKLFSSNVFKTPLLLPLEEVKNCDDVLVTELSNEIDVVLLLNTSCNNNTCNEELDQLKRIAQRYEGLTELNFKVISTLPIQVSWNYKNIGVITKNEPIDLSCLKGLDSELFSNNLLLFDKLNNLRGIYEIERDEVDRLIIELDILNQYN